MPLDEIKVNSSKKTCNDCELDTLRLKKAMEFVGDAILIANKDNEFIYHNLTFKSIFGYDHNKINMIGRGLSILFQDEQVFLNIVNVLKEKHHWYGKIFMKSTSGELFPVLLRSKLIIENDETIGILYVFRDISINVNLKYEKEKLSKKLGEAEKLARLGQLSSAFAHELNNPLDIIQTKLFLLKKSLQSADISDEASTHLEKLDHQINRLTNLSQSVLQYAKPWFQKRYLVNVNDIIMLTIDFLDEYWANKVEVVTRLEPKLPFIMGDAIGLEIVIKNILMNAFEAMNNMGEIIVESKESDDFLIVIITDHGVGISEGARAKIFQPFFTQKSDSGGSGLGLKISKKIIEEHGGTLEIESEINIGTTVMIKLPIAKS